MVAPVAPPDCACSAPTRTDKSYFVALTFRIGKLVQDRRNDKDEASRISRHTAQFGPAKYVDELMRVARFSDRNGFAGILLFAGNDTLVEPWSIAQHILAHTAESSPLIAVNPIYMHPFTAAKFVSSFALLYRRKIYLNMITGTAASDLHGLRRTAFPSRQIYKTGRIHPHCASTVDQHQTREFQRKVLQDGQLQLRPGLPPALMPEFLIAGQSDDAHRIAKQMGCLMMQMLPPNLDEGINGPGVNFGIFAREGRNEARREAKLFFQDSAEKRELLKYTMKNTNSVWKRRLNDAGRAKRRTS